MRLTTLALILTAMALAAFYLGRRRALVASQGPRGGTAQRLHSLPKYYGYFTALWCVLPGVVLLLGWIALSDAVITSRVVDSLPEVLRNQPESSLSLTLNDIRNLAAGQMVDESRRAEFAVAAELYNDLRAASQRLLSGLMIAVSFLGFAVAWTRFRPQFRARNHVELALKIALIAASMVAILTTLGILLSVTFEAIRFFRQVPFDDFLLGLTWSPQTAIRPDQVGSSGAFGAIPLFAGTLLISGIALFVAVPIGLMIAIYLSEYALPSLRRVVKPVLEVLAGIPTVVYGYFAALTVAPVIRDLGASMGLEVASESALGAGLVMGIMIIPFVSSLSDDVINAVPSAMRDGSYALGATKSETIKRVVLRAALPGIVGGVLLAASRAIGETMIVVMAAGLSANLTANPLESVTTVTVQIVTLLVGDQEFDSPKTLAAFALGLVLFVVTLILNIIALQVVRRYREQYD
ncbi:MAG: phosphate ABC transporter permease subunit PstC [Gammaproteobacteria bacterium]|nr:phosphate ABC transporter permease subunit PstC [Gammaproteobacteria bacterium]